MQTRNPLSPDDDDQIIKKRIDQRLRGPVDPDFKDIGGVWDEQRKALRQEAIEHEKKKAARMELRRKAGLVGVVKTELFGKQPPKLPKPGDDSAKTVEIKIALPVLPKLSLPKLPKVRPAYIKNLTRITRKKVVVGSVIIVVAVASCAGYYLSNRPKAPAINAEATSAPQDLVRGTPDYPTVVPDGKNIEDLGGWTRVSPPDRDPVFAYTDKIDEVPINVSQQPLPEDFKSDTAEHIEQLARGFKATEKITVGSTDVHIGTSAQGPQSVIFSQNDILILIKSTAPIDKNKWTQYVSSLQ